MVWRFQHQKFLSESILAWVLKLLYLVQNSQTTHLKLIKQIKKKNYVWEDRVVTTQ